MLNINPLSQRADSQGQQGMENSKNCLLPTEVDSIPTVLCRIYLWKCSMFSSLGTFFSHLFCFSAGRDDRQEVFENSEGLCFSRLQFRDTGKKSLEPREFISIAYMCLCKPLGKNRVRIR
ncbi:hypothetical protein TNCV_4564641 [Trichonephila clavipes]|nr:hypothetical protein TNCV_4564641 [Trichonephila clavipes]